MKKATIVSINGELKARVIKDFILDLPQYNYYPLFNHQKEWLKEGMEVEGEIVFSNGFKILNGERLVSMNLSSYKNYFKVSLSQSPVNEGTATDKKEVFTFNNERLYTKEEVEEIREKAFKAGRMGVEDGQYIYDTFEEYQQENPTRN